MEESEKEKKKNYIWTLSTLTNMTLIYFWMDFIWIFLSLFNRIRLIFDFSSLHYVRSSFGIKWWNRDSGSGLKEDENGLVKVFSDWEKDQSFTS